MTSINRIICKSASIICTLIHLDQCYIGATIFAGRQAIIKSGGFKSMPYSAESELIPRMAVDFTMHKVDFPTCVCYSGRDDSICTRRKKSNL